MYQRTHSSMMSASNTRLRYIGSRAIGFVIRHLGQTKSGSLSDVPGCTRTAHTLGRKVLNELHTLVTPDTLLRWYREMVACKWNYSHRRGPGRPRIMQTIVNLVLRMALENRSWGYRRIPGAMANLGHEVGRSTIANMLREYGVDPAPERDKHMPWSTFLRAHRECLVATDFLTVEVCTIRALVTHYVLFFIDIVNRAVKIAGITPH